MVKYNSLPGIVKGNKRSQYCIALLKLLLVASAIPNKNKACALLLSNCRAFSNNCVGLPFNPSAFVAANDSA